MSDVNTAHVDTMTASVKVIMMGRRQLTKSVFRQLDIVADATTIDVMGRVKDEKAGDAYDRWIIGVYRDDGTLVRVPVRFGIALDDNEMYAKCLYDNCDLIVLAG